MVDKDGQQKAKFTPLYVKNGKTIQQDLPTPLHCSFAHVEHARQNTTLHTSHHASRLRLPSVGVEGGPAHQIVRHHLRPGSDGATTSKSISPQWQQPIPDGSNGQLENRPTPKGTALLAWTFPSAGGSFWWSPEM